MKYLLSIFSIALVLCGTQSAVHGAIVMTIDSSAETISFSGSDTGSAKQVSDSSRLYDIAWTVGTGGTSAGNLNVSSLFTSSSPDASFVSMTVGFTESRFTLNSVWDSNDQVPNRYSSLTSYKSPSQDSATRSRMQVLIQPESLTTGSTMPLSNGTDATAISVVAVPEPSTVGLLFGGAAGLLSLRAERASGSWPGRTNQLQILMSGFGITPLQKQKIYFGTALY